MPFSSQNEAKQFLAELIALEAKREGEALSDAERKLLLFSVDEPESAEGIPEERLYQDDSDFEYRAGRIFKTIYKNADREQKKRIDQALSELKNGDHYILVVTNAI